MNITITINTDNAAFEDNFGLELDSILEQADRKARLLLHGQDSEPLLDSNGNTVGKVEVTE